MCTCVAFIGIACLMWGGVAVGSCMSVSVLACEHSVWFIHVFMLDEAASAHVYECVCECVCVCVCVCV